MKTVSTNRETAHRLLDDVPDADLESVLEFLASRRAGRPAGDGAYPALVPAYGGRRATSDEFQRLLGSLTTDGEG